MVPPVYPLDNTWLPGQRQLEIPFIVIVQRLCHPLTEKRKCHHDEKRGDIE
jgi:hypothetical protein